MENIQKTGLNAKKIINQDEINYFLDLLDRKRHSQESKQLIRQLIKTEFQQFGYNVSEQNAGRFINIIADKGDISNNHILLGAHYNSVPGTMGYYSDAPNTQSVPRFYSLIYRDLFNRLRSNNMKGNFSAAICSSNARDCCNKYESYGSCLKLEVYTVHIPTLYFIRGFFMDLFRSDHTPFLLDGTASVMITDTANFRNPNYHSITDSRNTINPEFIEKQANALLSTIESYST